MTPREFGRDETEVGLTRREDFGGTELSRSPETSMAAMAAQQKALVEARFVVAARYLRRDWMQVRVGINRLCENPGFAAEALYVKPMSKTPDEWQKWSKRDKLLNAPEDWPTGFSIRFVEAAIFEAKNIDVTQNVIWEDAEVRRTTVCVMDLESNVAYSRTITTKKVVERRYVKQGQETLGQRVNTNGQIVHLIEATDAEVNQLEAAAVSKAIRTLGEKLLPPQDKIEWKDRIWATLEKQAAEDPDGERKKLIDAFAEKRIDPKHLAEYLGHPVEQSTPAEIIKLRGIYMVIAEGVASWADVMAGPPAEGEKPTPIALKIKESIDRQQKKAEAPKAAPQAIPEQAKPAAESAKQENGSAPASPAGQTAPAQSAPATQPAETEKQPEAAKAQETAKAEPAQAGPKSIPTYTSDNLPTDDLKEGEECYYNGKHIRAVVPEPGEAPTWKRIGEAPGADKPKSKGKDRNPGALDFT
jgi:hypothetical protein